MLSNPVIEKQQRLEAEEKKKNEFRHDFIVKLIVKHTDTIQDIREFTSMKNFCAEQKVIFSAREYDSDKYQEDCNYISKLPAYHMYSRNGKDYWCTFYPHENAKQIILKEIENLRKEQEKKENRKKIWNEKIKSIFAYFENLSKRKTALQEPLPTKQKKRSEVVPIEYTK